MDFWDAVSRGMDRLANKLDEYADRAGSAVRETEFTVMDKEYCWEDLDYSGSDTLQRHVVSGECRLIDKYGQVIRRGTREQLESYMQKRQAESDSARAAGLGAGNPHYAVPTPSAAQVTPISPFKAAQPQTAAPAVNPYTGSDPTVQTIRPTQPYQPVRARYGDIIGVVRRNGAYEHYGIYVSDTCIIHYAIPASMTIGHATVHATNLRGFLRDDSEYFVLDFPRPYSPPVRIDSQGQTPHTETVSEELARHLQQQYGYHLYTPDETVARARSRLGETSYSILTNNCEHFAFWCKTGVSESMQISGMLQSLLNNQGWHFRNPVLR